MPQPIEEIRKFREKKLKNWQEAGFEPYPEKVERKFEIKEILKNFSKFCREKKKVSLGGRIFSLRDQGKIIFLDLKEGKDKIQIVLKKDTLKNFDFLKENLDIGDFIAVKGVVFLTKKREKSILAKEIVLAAKSLRPLPSSWYGLADVEERFRKRYLDLLINEGIKEKFDLRFELIKEIRKFFWQEGFLEVETPILQPLFGGANAKPFITHHNALNVDLYLRIAPELYLKRLIIGGYQKIFEIGKNFRNEGIDREHNPEFTMIEFYWAWQDSEFLRKFVENFLKKIIRKFFKKGKVNWQGKEIDFTKKFKVLDIVDLVKKETGIDFEKNSQKEILNKVKKIDLEIEEKKLISLDDKNLEISLLFDALFKKVCRPKIIQPTFVINHPWQISPLAKRKRNKPERVSRFQLIIAGMEIVNGFSELNDPQEQERRFKEQERLRKKGEEEGQKYDPDFLEALEYGMPPTAGAGLGIDRLAMILTNSTSVKEVILFPLLKEKND